MPTRPLAALSSLLLAIASPACSIGDIGDIDYDGGVVISVPLPNTLIFHGLVTSAATGEPLPGVTVRIDAPARGWSEDALTGPAGYYVTSGLPDPSSGACVGLSVSFSREGYQPLRVVDFPLLSCGRGYGYVTASLTPNP